MNGWPKRLARALAAAISGERLSNETLLKRCGAIVTRRPAWLRGLIKRIVQTFGEGSRPGEARLFRFILEDRRFLKACEKGPVGWVAGEPPPRQKMSPAAGAPQSWKVTPVCTIGEMARWLNLTPNELEWFADCRMHEAKLPEGPLRHYRYRWQVKRGGSARLIESPKQRLKAIQRYLLRQILEQIPPHEAVHGFRHERSIRTFTAPHVGRHLVLRLDLKDFFPSIRRARVAAIFRTAGYPERVAQFLTGLCTNVAPTDVIRACPASDRRQLRHEKILYQHSHLPQGAPTSPALANLAAYRLDCRLAGLAEAVGAQYTRYADDLVFSGGETFARMAERFYIRVCAIALEEGFEVHTRKTRIMRQSVSQRAAGVVLNQRANVPRRAYERLKATIHNCVTRGPAGENRTGVADFRTHLAGRIAHVAMLNPKRGQRLLADFDRIKWPANHNS